MILYESHGVSTVCSKACSGLKSIHSSKRGSLSSIEPLQRTIIVKSKFKYFLNDSENYFFNYLRSYPANNELMSKDKDNKAVMGIFPGWTNNHASRVGTSLRPGRYTGAWIHIISSRILVPVIAGPYMRICASGAGISGAWIIKHTPWNTAWFNHLSLPWIDLFIARKFLINIPYNRVYPNRCADGFNVLCLVVLYNDYKMASFHLLVYPYFPGLAGGVMPSCQWSYPARHGQKILFQTTTTHNKTWTMCLMLGLYSDVTWVLRRLKSSQLDCLFKSLFVKARDADSISPILFWHVQISFLLSGYLL